MPRDTKVSRGVEARRNVDLAITKFIRKAKGPWPHGYRFIVLLRTSDPEGGPHAEHE